MVASMSTSLHNNDCVLLWRLNVKKLYRRSQSKRCLTCVHMCVYFCASFTTLFHYSCCFLSVCFRLKLGRLVYSFVYYTLYSIPPKYMQNIRAHITFLNTRIWRKSMGFGFNQLFLRNTLKCLTHGENMTFGFFVRLLDNFWKRLAWTLFKGHQSRTVFKFETNRSTRSRVALWVR